MIQQLNLYNIHAQSSMIGRDYHDYGTPTNQPTCQNKESNPCTFVTVGVLILDNFNNMDILQNIKQIGKVSINKLI